MMHVFSVAPPRLGGIDMLLPIFLEMKRSGSINIELIFIDDLAFRQLERDDFLFGQVSECVDKISFLPKKNIRASSNPVIIFHHLLLFIFKLLGVLYRITTTYKPVMMHSGRVSDSLLGIFHKAIKLRRGFTVAHFKLMDLYYNNNKHINVQDDFGDIFICFNKKNVSSWDNSSKSKCIEIGYPRLYESWLENLRNNSKYYVQKHIKETATEMSPLAVLFLPSTVKGVFEENELKDWIFEIVHCLSEQFDDALIVLKPHPMQNFKHLANILDELNNRRCILSFLHPGILAAEAKLVISHHSSTIVDALALETPVIQHQNFTTHWLKRHPEGSSFLELGHPWTKNVEGLTFELKKIKNNEWVPPNFVSHIGHQNSIKALFEKIELL
jgi:hypothetical protein